jgi:hypothetical protein
MGKAVSVASFGVKLRGPMSVGRASEQRNMEKSDKHRIGIEFLESNKSES